MIRDGKVLGEYVFGTNKNKHLLTKEEIMAIRDPAVRQAEIAKNPEVFGLKFD